ncbi:MAG: hypothetical protein J6W06_11540 [Bacteroidales bacterium]|nr:hypothetical protein [Bacteroidales bacterium]
MKKYFLLIVSMIALMYAGSSCGGSKESKSENPDFVLKPSKVEITGPLKDYFRVVDKSFNCKYDESAWDKYMITIELERTDVDFDGKFDGYEPFGTSGYGVEGNYGFGIELRDSMDNIVYNCAATASGLSGVYSSDDLKALMKLNSGETGIVRWSENLGKINIEGTNLTFKITSACDENQKGSSSSKSEATDDDDDSSDYSSSSFDSNSDEDWDAFLDEYEEYVDDYVALYKKAKNGDMDAMSEYAEVLEDAQDLSNRLSKAKSSMSSSQTARYTKITNKMLNAMN